ncbi:MAG TPA: DinB family protein [Candidatus Limnocylindria bacterium]|jgi:uncharacterized damage-inducible protein DinB|nr:DinB family protein [Candidatus Limnocylindria bacterium]
MTTDFAAVPRSMLGDAMAHHLWATARVLDVCEPLSEEQLATPQPGTYGPIVGTLRHLVETDRWYLGFFPGTGDSLPTIPEDNEMTLAEMRAVMRDNADAWTAILSAHPESDADLPEIEPEWEFHAPVGFRLAQVVHHGTDHRSQICTALTALGIEPPQIDVWAYGEATGRTRAVELQHR